jgi:hypothetical protein
MSASFWSAASAVAGIGVLVVTAVYAWLTHRLARVAEKQNWESGRARVIVSIGSNQGGQLLLLEIMNVGVGSAEDLRVTIDKPLHQQLGQSRAITEAPFFRDGLRALPPGKALKFALGVSFHWLNEQADRTLHPSTFDVQVLYKTLDRQVAEVYPIDIEQQFSLSAVDRDYLDDFGRTFPQKFEKSVRSIQRSIDNLGKSKPDPLPARRSWSGWFTKDIERKREWQRY